MADTAVLPRRRLLSHPVVWAVPLVVLVALTVQPLNDGFYEQMINSDPQGDDQLYEWYRTTLIFRYTTGLLYGQMLALLAGAVLATRHRMPVALAIAGPLAAAMAAAVFAVGQLMGSSGQATHIDYIPLDDPVFVRMLVRELAAYPLFALAGVGLGVLLRNWTRLYPGRVVLWLLPAWIVATLTGLWQSGDGDAPHWLYWAVPPIGTATAVSGSGMSMGTAPGGAPVLYGDWGNEAGIAMLVGAALWAVVLNLLAIIVRPRGRRLTSTALEVAL